MAEVSKCFVALKMESTKHSSVNLQFVFLFDWFEQKKHQKTRGFYCFKTPALCPKPPRLPGSPWPMPRKSKPRRSKGGWRPWTGACLMAWEGRCWEEKSSSLGSLDSSLGSLGSLGRLVEEIRWLVGCLLCKYRYRILKRPGRKMVAKEKGGRLGRLLGLVAW